MCLLRRQSVVIYDIITFGSDEKGPQMFNNDDNDKRQVQIPEPKQNPANDPSQTSRTFSNDDVEYAEYTNPLPPEDND